MTTLFIALTIALLVIGAFGLVVWLYLRNLKAHDKDAQTMLSLRGLGEL